MFESLPMKPGGNILDLPMIDSYYKINYYGPHISLSYVSDEYVISAIRQVDLPDIHDVYVYIESDFRLTQNILESTHLVANTYSLMLDQEGRVVYSEIPDLFPIDTMFHQNDEERQVDGDEEFGKNKDYYWFKQISNQGWSVVSVISMKDYNMERNNWITSMIITYFVLLLFSGVLGILMWKAIHFSLKRFEKEIELVSNNQFTENIEPMGVPEFDALMTQFLKMKGEIRRLIREIGQKEKRRADLEIEKLRYQINPHFLMNTLNTIHWMAVINKQPGIDKTIMSLNKLLAYNLGKDGFQSTIENEINAVKEYVYIQKSKLKFDFYIQCNIPEEYLLTKTPRFIIQPLVENAIFHGIKKDGRIWITIDIDENIVIGIHDNGKGMQFDLNLDFSDQYDKPKYDIYMGIGIRYVVQSLNSFYGKKAKLEVKSENGEGTSVYIRIPF
jgi:two-component system sensor histidine kinase YesM